MTLIVADRVQETTLTTGTSDYTLLGAKTGFQSFGAVMANADTTYYAVTDGTAWEVGIGTYSTTGPTMARTTILSSSNAGAAVSWGAGTKDIFLSYAASKSVYLDASGNLSVDGTTLFVDATNDRVGIGTNTPAVKEEILGNTLVAAQFFSNTVSGTTLDVTTLISGALAVGQYLGTPNGRVRIIALGTGTGGVGTYILDTDQTGFSFQRSYDDVPITMRLGNSATFWSRNIPYGTVEFGGAFTNTGPRGYIQTQASASGSPSAVGSMLFGVGQTDGAAPPRTAMSLGPSATSLAGNLTLGNASLSPRNLTISPATLGFQGRSQTIYSAGNFLSYMTFNANYIDASVETSVQYGVVGYNVDGSITSGQLPSNFFVQTRNASGTIAERFRIDKDGNVGIGTTAPGNALVLNRAGATNTYLQMYNGANTSGYVHGLGTDGNVYSYAAGAFDLIFGTNGTERMRIDASGNLGLGVTPSSGSLRQFEIGAVGNAITGYPADAAIYVTSNAVYASGWKYTQTGKLATRYASEAGAHSWSTAPSGTAGNAISFTQAMTLDASGNLGIGTTAPVLNATGTFTHINASGTNAAAVHLTNGATGAAANDGMILARWNDGNNYLWVYENEPLSIGTNNTQRLYIDASGAITAAGTVTAGGFVGPLTGNATTATSLSTDRTNWVTNGTVADVVGQLAWKNYGNNHTIFDASNGTSPDGTAVSTSNPTYPWTSTFPTLMGWNGVQTYGVRVDNARLADVVNTITSAQVGAATAGLALGAVGTYALLSYPLSNGTFVEGTLIAGSSLVYGGYRTSSNPPANAAYGVGLGASPAGTWMVVGAARTNGTANWWPTSVFLRIS